MQLVSKSNKRLWFLSWIIDIYSKYAWTVPLKDKNAVTNVFQKVSNESNCKPNKIWVDKYTEFYIRPIKSWLQDNDIQMYLTNNEAKSVDDERFTRTLKNKAYKCMTLVSKNVYIDKLDDILNKYNNIYHDTFKMKPDNVKSDTYLSGIENNKEGPKFEVGDHVTISK